MPTAAAAGAINGLTYLVGLLAIRSGPTATGMLYTWLLTALQYREHAAAWQICMACTSLLARNRPEGVFAHRILEDREGRLEDLQGDDAHRAAAALARDMAEVCPQVMRDGLVAAAAQIEDRLARACAEAEGVDG